MTTKIINARMILPGGVREGCDLYFSRGKITAVTAQALSHDQIIDARGMMLAPGFIDIHTHGAGDADFMDGTVEAFLTAANTHARFGATTIVPTATSGTREEMLIMGRTYENACRENFSGADMPGLHLEGPYFSPEQCGAQDPRYVRAPQKEEYEAILDACSHILRWSAAPELPGAQEFARELRKRGIIAAIGHTNADYQDVEDAVKAGFSHVTHLYSCMSTVHRINAYRYGGVVEAAYLMDDLSVEMIADGCHLPPELLKFVYRFKGPEKTALITDSMRGAGMPDGTLSVLGSRANGQTVVLEDGVAKLMDRSAFAGSTATCDRLVRNMIRLAGVPLTDAVRMASATPARIMGLNDRGALEEGKRADFVIFDEDIQVHRTIVGGRTVYERTE